MIIRFAIWDHVTGIAGLPATACPRPTPGLATLQHAVRHSRTQQRDSSPSLSHDTSRENGHAASAGQQELPSMIRRPMSGDGRLAFCPMARRAALAAR